MKKILAIFFAMLILLSGMHLSVAKHLCGGEVAGVKWSFSGKIASCGMESSNSNCIAANLRVTSNCCKDEIKYFTTDNNFGPHDFQKLEIGQKILHTVYFPVNILFTYSGFSFFSEMSKSPPENPLLTSVVLPLICVFRI